VVGAVVLFAWAWFLAGFLTEPSATGRSRLVLLLYVLYSVLAGLIGLGAAAGALRGARWGRAGVLLAGAAMSLTCVGALAGIPALLGALSGRGSPSN